MEIGICNQTVRAVPLDWALFLYRNKLKLCRYGPTATLSENICLTTVPNAASPRRQARYARDAARNSVWDRIFALSAVRNRP